MSGKCVIINKDLSQVKTHVIIKLIWKEGLPFTATCIDIKER